MIYRRLKNIAYLRKALSGYYLLPDGRAFSPTTVAFLPTMRCNLHCQMCGQWGECGYLNAASAQALKNEELPIESWEKVIDELAPSRPRVIVWGGEPFLYREMIRLLRRIKSKGLNCLVISNGTLIAPYAHEFVMAGIDEIEISLDGPSQVNDKMRGAGSYNAAIEGIATLLDERKRQKNNYPKIIINTVITKDSYLTLSEMVELSKKLGVDGINLIYGWCISSSAGKRYEDFCKDLFGIEATSWKGFEKNEADIDLDKLSEITRSIRAGKAGGLSITFLPDLSHLGVAGFYQDRLASIPKRCFSLWHRADIRHNGDVVFCGDFPDYVIGNIKNEPFLSIWNNDRARTFRKVIKGSGLLPVCSRCCNLYNYNFSRVLK